jgi:hypothetical protein
LLRSMRRILPLHLKSYKKSTEKRRSCFGEKGQGRNWNWKWSSQKIRLATNTLFCWNPIFRRQNFFFFRPLVTNCPPEKGKWFSKPKIWLCTKSTSHLSEQFTDTWNVCPNKQSNRISTKWVLKFSITSFNPESEHQSWSFLVSICGDTMWR